MLLDKVIVNFNILGVLMEHNFFYNSNDTSVVNIERNETNKIDPKLSK